MRLSHTKYRTDKDRTDRRDKVSIELVSALLIGTVVLLATERPLIMILRDRALHGK